MKDAQSVTIQFSSENTKAFRNNQKLPSINNRLKNEDYKEEGKIEEENENKPSRCPCTNKQLAIIMIPSAVVALFLTIFLTIYLTNNDDEEEFDEFEENVANYSYATLIPKNGYNNIYIHLGGISEVANKYFDFFKSKSTYIPKKTKLYFLTGQERVMKYMEQWNYYNPVPGWFNVDQNGALISDSTGDEFNEAKESLAYILDKIDEIKSNENIDYNKIYLGGFSQGGIMTNYVLLNSRHELGGYMAFSGYIFDHRFPTNSVVDSLTAEQTAVLESKKHYHILAAHSFNDGNVPYFKSVEAYCKYFKEYTDFKLYSFGNLIHLFVEQPIHKEARAWLKKSMGK